MQISNTAAAAVAEPPARDLPSPPPAKFTHVFDFPTLQPGDSFRVARGSTANGFSVGGEARIDELAPDRATLWLKVGRFGISREVSIAVQQASEATVQITATEPGKQPQAGVSDIVAVRTNYSEFRTPDSARLAGSAVLQMDEQGRLLLDLTSGANDARDAVELHLILERRP